MRERERSPRRDGNAPRGGLRAATTMSMYDRDVDGVPDESAYDSDGILDAKGNLRPPGCIGVIIYDVSETTVE